MEKFSILGRRMPRVDALEKVAGEALAVVAATSEEVAEEALDLIHVEYESLPGVFDPMEAMKPGALQIHQAEKNIAAHVPMGRGDVEEGFKKADRQGQRRQYSQTPQSNAEKHQAVYRRAGAVSEKSFYPA